MNGNNFCGFVVSLKKMSKDDTVPVGAWIRHDDILLKQISELVDLEKHLNGRVIVTDNKSGAIAVWWFVPLENQRQVQTAMATLSRIVSRIVGVELIQRQLATPRDVIRALAA